MASWTGSHDRSNFVLGGIETLSEPHTEPMAQKYEYKPQAKLRSPANCLTFSELDSKKTNSKGLKGVRDYQSIITQTKT